MDFAQAISCSLRGCFHINQAGAPLSRATIADDGRTGMEACRGERTGLFFCETLFFFLSPQAACIDRWMRRVLC